MISQDIKFEKLKRELPRIQNNIFLNKHTTFKIGGPAKYFLVAKTKEELIRAIKTAKEFNLPFFILGNGSNVLALDEGFNGLVIRIHNSKFIIHNSKISAEAGVKLKDLVKLAAREGLAGLEWAAGIPGTVGGAVWGNAQAFNSKMSNIIKTVEVLDAKTFKIKNLSKKQCQFSNKNSIFKKNKNFIILSAVFGLKKGDKKEIKKKIRENLKYRKKNHPLDFPSAGCAFINPKKIFPSAYLIDKCGLKGKKIGGAQISEKHANFIINLGNAKAKDVLALIKLARQKVKKKFGIVLKKEIEVVK